jgi:hypothetical protein
VVLLSIIFILTHIVSIGQVTFEIVLEQVNFELIAFKEDPEDTLRHN